MLRNNGRKRSWRRLLSGLFLCLLAAGMLRADPTTSDADNAGRLGRIGKNLMCVCSCGQRLLECNHVGCPSSGPMINELREQLAGPNGTGADALILNWFVAKYGAIVLSAPIRGGFDNVAWIMPVAMFLLATIGTAYVVKLWSRKRQGLRAATVSGAAVDDDIRARIRRETEY